MSDVFLVRQDKCPRHASDQGTRVFSSLEKARLWTEQVDREEHGRNRAMVLKRDGPNTDVSAFDFFLNCAGVFTERAEWEADNEWHCGDGWYITQEVVDQEEKEGVPA